MKRREFLAAGAALGAVAAGAGEKEMAGTRPRGSITEVAGLKVGHFTDKRRPTGCTVILAEEGAVAGVDVRGGAPGTRETDLLDPVRTVSQIHGVMLSGGSSFGLAAADGAMKYLEEKGIGVQVGKAIVPIVPAAILFDLMVGDGSVRPDAEAGYKACQAARGGPDAVVEQGNVGAGAGATVGKMLGREHAMKSGLGTASVRLPNGLVVAALAAVNAVGDIYDPQNGRLLAGARAAGGKTLENMVDLLRRGELRQLKEPLSRENTTLGVVATNATLTKAEANKVAQVAHDGLALAIRPAHLPSDGDTIFALATGKLPASAGLYGLIGALAADVFASAVVSAILHARSIPGYPAWSDLQDASADPSRK